jgi:fructose-1,6-bisphosphatase/sedoheptulose 1,7-bisphosphatase-like protein
MTDELRFQNEMVLAVVQALIGAVDSNLRAVAIATNSETRVLTLFFAVSSREARLVDFIEEIETDVSALTDGSVEVVSRIWEGSSWSQLAWPGRSERLIFGCHEG